MILYRGESLSSTRDDPQRVEAIQCFHKPGQGLLSKLANRGNPYRLAKLGLDQAIKSHIVPDGTFTLTHFLSFASRKERAEFFATDMFPPEVEVVRAGRAEGELWPHTAYVIFQFDVRSKEPVPDAPGFFTVTYGGTHRAMLIDAVRYLEGIPIRERNAQHAKALEYATVDTEWLVLPLDLIEDGTLSAILHKSSELSVEHYVDADYYVNVDSSAVFIP